MKKSAKRLSQRTNSGVVHVMVCAKLLAQTQFGDQGHVTVSVLVLEVIEQFTTTADHAQQAAAAVVVFGVGFEVRGQFIDA